MIFANPYIRWMSGNYCQPDEINLIIKETCQKLEDPLFANKIRWSFSTRLFSTLAYATWEKTGHSIDYQIKFSAVNWLALDDIRRRHVIIHEVCHLFVEKLYGDDCNVTAHGKHWKDLMRQCGEIPSRTVKCDIR